MDFVGWLVVLLVAVGLFCFVCLFQKNLVRQRSLSWIMSSSTEGFILKINVYMFLPTGSKMSCESYPYLNLHRDIA